MPIQDLYNAPFWQVHELYKIVVERAEAQKKAEEERIHKEKEEEERQKREEARKAGRPYRPSPPERPVTQNSVPVDESNNNMPTPSPAVSTDDMEEFFEELT